MYWELSRLRFGKNQLSQVEPNGSEKFDEVIEPKSQDGRRDLRTAS
jgi:hypothetical protein